MRSSMILLVFLGGLATALNADTLGVAVSGTCEAGSCPPTPVLFNTTANLPFDFNVTLADGDKYLIFGTMTVTNDGDGGGFNTFNFEVMYEGNASGGVSAADTIVVERQAEFEASLPSDFFVTSLLGAFSPGIASSSSASTCFGGTLACLGPVTPPGAFDENSADFGVTNVGGVLTDEKTFTNNFGAGSPVGSFIVWGQTTPLPVPAAVPEPASIGLLAIGFVGAAALRMGRERRRRS